MSVLAPIPLTPVHARRFALHALGLASPSGDIATVLRHHGYLQIDPINICGRMPEHLLRNRVAGYREGGLFRHLYGNGTAPPPAPEDRTGFEHYYTPLGILVAYPCEAYPHLRGAMAARARRDGTWSGRLDRTQRRMAAHLFERLADGPLSSADIEHGDTVTNGWGRARLAKTTLDKLFFHGRVLITRRDNYRRVFDLPERVLPAAVLGAPRPTARATVRWEILTKLRQRRLCTLKRAELPLVASLVQPVAIEGGPTAYLLREDLPLLDAVRSGAAPAIPGHAVRLLAPLDPLIYDRVLTRRLWNYDYTWEVYTPPARRVRGYYALPLLAGECLVGHADLRANRSAGMLDIVSMQAPAAVDPRPALRDLAAFLGLKLA